MKSFFPHFKINIKMSEYENKVALIQAIEECDLSRAEELLKINVKVNFHDDDGLITPLIKASRKDDFDMIYLLLNYDADPNFANKLGETPLMVAVRRLNVDIIDLLLDNNAVVNRHGFVEPILSRQTRTNLKGSFLSVRNQYDKYGSTLLTELLRYKYGSKLLTELFRNKRDNATVGVILEILLEHGLNINLVNNRGETALINAVKGHDIDAVKILLQYDADPNYIDHYGNTALIKLVKGCYTNSDMIDLLFVQYGANVDIINNEHYTAFMIAAKYPKDDIVLKLLDSGKIAVNDGNRGLGVAIENGNESTIELIKSYLSE